MENKIEFFNWLWKKLYLASVGFYITIGLIMFLPKLMVNIFNIKPIASSLIAYFLVMFFRAAYESLIIYDYKIKKLSLNKMIKLSLVSSIIMIFVSYFLKPKMGHFAIPVSLIISMFFVKKLKEKIWAPAKRAGILKDLAKKIEQVSLGRYSFFLFLVGITYLGYAKFNFGFFYSFGIGFFVGIMFQEIYNLVKLFEQKINFINLIIITIWSLFCAIASGTLVALFMYKFDYSGQIATVSSVILLKLIQPLWLKITIK